MCDIVRYFTVHNRHLIIKKIVYLKCSKMTANKFLWLVVINIFNIYESVILKNKSEEKCEFHVPPQRKTKSSLWKHQSNLQKKNIRGNNQCFVYSKSNKEYRTSNSLGFRNGSLSTKILSRRHIPNALPCRALVGSHRRGYFFRYVCGVVSNLSFL